MKSQINVIKGLKINSKGMGIPEEGLRNRVGAATKTSHKESPAGGPFGPKGEMAQSQKQVDVKRFSDKYPPLGQIEKWPRGSKSSGKTSCFGHLAHVVAHRGEFLGKKCML